MNSLFLAMLTCQSLVTVEGWKGVATQDYVYFSAQVQDESTLLDARVEGAYASDVADMVAQSDDQGKFSRTKFGTLEDAWNYFNVLLPKNFDEVDGTFKAAVQIYKEDEPYPRYVDMNCSVK